VLTLPAPGVVPPAALEQVAGSYTREAIRARTQGVVWLSCVVEADGSVGEIRVTRSLDRGLDEQAVAAVKQWRFRPATRDGAAVRVVVPVSIAFTLKGEPPPSTWPGLFPGATDATAPDADWTEVRADAAGVALRVEHPSTWTVRRGDTYLLTIVSPDGRHFVSIGQPFPLPGPVALPIPVGQLNQANLSFSRMIGGHDFSSIDGGQARTRDRWWLWQDQVMQTSQASRLAPDVRDAFSAEAEALRLWLFITFVDAKGITVFCTALVPHGLSPADLDRELRPAAAVFDRLIKRMVLQAAGPR
jgi:TonB family protein